MTRHPGAVYSEALLSQAKDLLPDPNSRRILADMRLSTLFLLAVILGNICFAAQSGAQQSGSYADTVQVLKAWTEDPDIEKTARVFAIGEGRVTDLITACHAPDERISTAAFLALQLGGTPESRECCSVLHPKHVAVAMSCAATPTLDFGQLEQQIARLDCEDDASAAIPDSLVYALILDGSPKAESLLKDLLAYSRRCEVTDTVVGETLSEYKSLLDAVHTAGLDLKAEDGTIENLVRNSAFFLPSEYRKGSDVKLLAHNRDRSRVLLEISYHCGMLCGRGYYVVLEKSGNTWRYALIMMAWIS